MRAFGGEKRALRIDGDALEVLELRDVAGAVQVARRAGAGERGHLDARAGRHRRVGRAGHIGRRHVLHRDVGADRNRERDRSVRLERHRSRPMPNRDRAIVDERDGERERPATDARQILQRLSSASEFAVHIDRAIERRGLAIDVQIHLRNLPRRHVPAQLNRQIDRRRRRAPGQQHDPSPPQNRTSIAAGPVFPSDGRNESFDANTPTVTPTTTPATTTPPTIVHNHHFFHTGLSAIVLVAVGVGVIVGVGVGVGVGVATSSHPAPPASPSDALQSAPSAPTPAPSAKTTCTP